MGALVEGVLAIPFVLKTLDGDGPREMGDEDRGGFVEGRRPVTPDDIVFPCNGFFGVDDMLTNISIERRRKPHLTTLPRETLQAEKWDVY